MKLRNLLNSAAVLTIALLTYTAADAQVVDAVKDAAGKTKDVTVSTAKKTAVVVTDAFETAADKTPEVAGAVKDGTVTGARATASGAKSVASGVKTFGERSVTVTENVVGRSAETGKYYTVSTWDGTK
ncbi:MAG: hypothetical protein H0V76_03490, partial [Blastocatellia bacterium]|nr:hypothetical protein [Blastocatellia bacterium]